MRPIFLIIKILVLCNPIFAQLKIPALKYTSSDETFLSDSIIKALTKKSDVVILYMAYSTWSWNVKYQVINHDINNTWHYSVLSKSLLNEDDKEQKISAIDLPKASIKKIWQAFIDNDFFAIKNEADIKVNCKAHVYDALHYEFRIITKKQYKILDYYAPEYFEKQCPGNMERQKIIKCAKIVFSFTNYK
ncbi:MAG: hypothetical protein ABI707_08340 [Ferruginibacter sp.]